MELDPLLTWVNSYRKQKLREEEIIKEILKQQLDQLTLPGSDQTNQEKVVTVWSWNCHIIKKCISVGLFCAFSQVSSWMKEFGYSIFVYTDEEGVDQSFYFGLQYKVDQSIICDNQMQDLVSSEAYLRTELQQISLDVELLHAQSQQLAQRVTILEQKLGSSDLII